MSRIGRKPISVPEGVTVSLAPGRVTVNGPKGELAQELSSRMEVVEGRAR
jgi:large subunit ribosomal protein L6